MNRTRLTLLIVVAFIAAAVPFPRRASADTSSELLALINDAYTNFMALDSFTAESEQIYQATLEVLRMTLDFTYHADIASAVLPNDGDLTAHSSFDITMTSNMQPAPTSVAMEMFIDGDTIYARIGESDLKKDDSAGAIAPGWVNTDLLADEASPAYNGMNEATFLQLFGMNYPLTPGAYATVTELEPEEIDGQLMRVVQVHYTADQLDAAGQMDSLVDVFNGQAMGAWTEDITREMLTDGSVYALTLWIGADDHLPHRFGDLIEIDSSVNFEGYTATIAGTLTTTTTLTSINEPLTLLPPKTE